MAYVGPGDLKTYAWWCGLRAYSAATCGTACADVCATAGGSTTTINSLANGNFDVASAVTALGGNSGFIAKLYDQTGGGKHLVQTTGANQPKIKLNALQGGTLPEIDMTGAVAFATKFFMSDAGSFTVTNPWTMVALVNPTGNWSLARNVIDNGTNQGGGSQGLSWASATTFQFINDSFGGPTARTWAVPGYHRLIGVNVNSAAALTSLDGSIVTFTGDTAAWGSPGVNIGDVLGGYDLKALEFGVAASAFSSSDATATDSNMNSYWFGPGGIALTGAGMSASAGSFAKTAVLAITGAGMSSAAGSFAVKDTIAIPGAGASASAGTLAKTDTEALSGAGAAASAGSFAKAVVEPITGASATASAGTLSAGNNATVNLTGTGGTAAAGSFTEAESSTLTGAVATSAAGSFIETVAKVLPGAGVTVGAGTFANAIVTPLAGASMTAAAQGVDETVVVLASSTSGMVAQAGSFSVSSGSSSNVNLSGAGAVSAAGTFTDAVVKPFNGAGISASAGTLAEGDAVALPGGAATASAGSFAKAVTSPLSGAGAIANAGTISAFNGLGLALAGASANAQAGSMADAETKPMTGAGAVLSAGSLVSPVSPNLSGASGTAQAGSFGKSETVAFTGAQIAALAGFITAQIPGQTTLFGAFAHASAGILSVLTVDGFVHSARVVSIDAEYRSVPLTEAARSQTP